MSVSIVIPTLNEAQEIEKTLRCLSVLHPLPIEIIVVDGGSKDETVSLVENFREMPLSIEIIADCGKGRSVQMNAGAKIATGEILCFLHGDTLIPNDAIKIMEETLADSSISTGGFISLMVGSHRTLWGTAFHNYIKSYYAPLLFRPHLFFKGLRVLFGDQVIFCRRRDFWKYGGFDPTLPIMEDADLCIKLAQCGKTVQVNRIVQSSDRRVVEWGAFKANLIYLYIGILWGLGVRATYLKQFYKDIP